MIGVVGRVLGGLMLVAAAGLLIGDHATRAQEAGVFEVVIPLASLTQPTTDPGVTLGEGYMRITAYADGEQCAFVTTQSPDTDVVLTLGAPGQPAACSQAGATVTFLTGACHQLATQMTLAPGTRQTLDNLAPAPPGSVPPVSGCEPPPAPTIAPELQERTPPPGGIQPPNTGNAGLAVRLG